MRADIEQLDDGLRFLAVEALQVQPADINHITSARIAAGDGYSISCLLEILGRLSGLPEVDPAALQPLSLAPTGSDGGTTSTDPSTAAQLAGTRGRQLDTAAAYLGGSSPTDSSADADDDDDDAARTFLDAVYGRHMVDGLTLNPDGSPAAGERAGDWYGTAATEDVSSIEGGGPGANSSSDATDMLDMSLRVRQLVEQCRADWDSSDGSSDSLGVLSTAGNRAVLAPTPELLDRLNAPPTNTTGSTPSDAAAAAGGLGYQMGAAAAQQDGSWTLSHTDSLEDDAGDASYLELLKTPTNQPRRDELLRLILQRCQRPGDDDHDHAGGTDEAGAGPAATAGGARSPPRRSGQSSPARGGGGSPCKVSKGPRIGRGKQGHDFPVAAPWPAPTPPDLKQVLPGTNLDPHSARWLWNKYANRIEVVTRNVIRDATRPPKRGHVEQQVDTQNRKLTLLRKDVACQQRLLRQKLAGHHERAVRSHLAEHRRGTARMRRYYSEFHTAQSAKLKRKTNKEELLLREVFEKSLAEHREQILSMRQYAKDKKLIFERQQKDRLTSLSTWYKDQLQLLEASFAQAKLASKDDEAAVMQEVDKIRRAFRGRLEGRIQNMQDSLLEDDEAALMQRLRDIRLHM